MCFSPLFFKEKRVSCKALTCSDEARWARGPDSVYWAARAQSARGSLGAPRAHRCCRPLFIMYIHTYAHTHTHIWIHVYIFAYVYKLYIYIYIYIYIYVCMYLYICMYIYVCIQIYVFVEIYMYIKIVYIRLRSAWGSASAWSCRPLFWKQKLEGKNRD